MTTDEPTSNFKEKLEPEADANEPALLDGSRVAGSMTMMKKMLSSLVVVLCALVLVTPALAQDPGAKVKEINFEDDVIEGELQMPNQTNITGMQNDDLSTLIKAREDFVDQLLKSVEDL